MNDNKKIAINTVVLTVKLVITLTCSFVVSRLILQALGADNYGLYNVVGGIVSMLALISTSMVATSYRYIAVEIGKGAEEGNPQKVYSTLMLIHFVLAGLLIVIGEPIGAWYINNYLNVTSASIADAHFVFAFSLIASFFSIVAVPSNGLLIAEEKFLPISIIEILRSLLNIVMAFVLLNYFGNRLRLYAVLMAVLNIGGRIAFQLYCRIKYPSIVKFKLNKNKQDYKEITSFTGWMFLGATAVVGRSQGMALVINLFFRNSINAAFGVANHLWHAAQQFTTTLRQSVTPQIMKNQGGGNTARALSLVYAISRYTFLIMLIISVPLLLTMNKILQLWLGADNIPPLTEMFAIFLVIDGLVSSLRAGFDASIQASGRIKKNQIGYTIINISIIPIVYIFYRIGFPAYMNVVVGVILSFVTNLFQAWIMQELTEFTYLNYWNKTVLPSLLTTIAAFLPMIGLRVIIGDNTYVVLGFALFAALWTSLVVLFVGMNQKERRDILEFAKNKLLKLKTN